jgi:hypothetical protein
VTVICGASLYWLVLRSGMFEVLSVENTDENCEFSSFALVFRSPYTFPFSFRGLYLSFHTFNFDESTKFLVSPSPGLPCHLHIRYMMIYILFGSISVVSDILDRPFGFL